MWSGRSSVLRIIHFLISQNLLLNFINPNLGKQIHWNSILHIHNPPSYRNPKSNRFLSNSASFHLHHSSRLPPALFLSYTTTGVKTDCSSVSQRASSSNICIFLCTSNNSVILSISSRSVFFSAPLNHNQLLVSLFPSGLFLWLMDLHNLYGINEKLTILLFSSLHYQIKIASRSNYHKLPVVLKSLHEKSSNCTPTSKFILIH